MFSYVANRGLGWRKSNCCRPAKFPLQSILSDFVCSADDIYGHYDTDGNIPPLACCFCKKYNSSNILAVSDENGFITLFDTNLHGKKAVLRNWNAHSNAVFDLAWVDNTENLLTASGDQTIILWNTPSMEKIQVFSGHSKSVKSVSVKPNDPAIFCSGSRDGQILIYDMRINSKAGGCTTNVSAIKNAHTIAPTCNPPRKRARTHLTWRSGSTRNSLLSLDRHKSVTSVLFHTDNLLVSAGAVNNHIKVWDLRKCSGSQLNPTPAYTFSPLQNAVRNYGISDLVFDSSCTKIFASCKDNKIYQYDFASYSPHPVKTFRGLENASFYIKSSISPCDQYLICGSHDNTAYIWDIENSDSGYPCTQLNGHTAEVTTVTWSPYDFGKIATLSDDNTLRLWRIQRNKQLIEKNSSWGTAFKYDVPSCDIPVTESPSSSFLTNERLFPATPDFQKSTQQASPPVSLVGWLKTSTHRKGDHLELDSTPVSDSPGDFQVSMFNEGSQSKLNGSISGKTKNLAKRNLENSYEELQPCSSQSKRCNILRSPNRGDEKLAIKLDDVDTEDGQSETFKWFDANHDHSASQFESKSQEENLSPCQGRTIQNRLSEVQSELTLSSPSSDGTFKKTLIQPLISLTAILKTPTRQNIHSRSGKSSSQKHHKTPKTPNSTRKTPHKSSPTVMSGKQSILSYLNTNGSPSN